MRKIRIAIIIMFCTALLAPLAAFNWEENVVSPIDNRELMNNPFGENYEPGENASLLSDLSAYVEDRIGFRDEMILGYTLLNDRLFHKMVHPTYDYGQDGYVFFKTGRNVCFGEFHQEFARFIRKAQDYCQQRGIPFVFVLNPAKTTVLSEKLRKGINYDAGWVEEFLVCLDKLGVNYIDNTPLLKEKTAQGEAVFNRVYNAGHWNDLGAFYGCNAVLRYFQKDFPGLHINEIEDYQIEERLNTSLMVSEFPIHEDEPVFQPIDQIEEITEQYASEVAMDSQYRTFRYLRNPRRLAEGAPRVLSFQGSYMNGMGYKFLENSFGEYVIVHDYQNIFNLDYYVNIFQPDCVIFETAEYTFTGTYYDLEEMKAAEFYPSLDTEMVKARKEAVTEGMVYMEQGERLASITVQGLPEDTQRAYLVSDSLILDLIPADEVFFADEGFPAGDAASEAEENVYRAETEKERLAEGDLAIIAVNASGEMAAYQ